jgi:hypothetical protein
MILTNQAVEISTDGLLCDGCNYRVYSDCVHFDSGLERKYTRAGTLIGHRRCPQCLQAEKDEETKREPEKKPFTYECGYCGVVFSAEETPARCPRCKADW